ncbi:very short patch repair endonuclease [Catenulispora subtropica]|uniref:DNA mismatch endonuclease Vsr n=1 Tax=Catenulispora subtropica TaxID=450798 RepID=A0ABN2TDT0_9ACTN
MTRKANLVEGFGQARAAGLLTIAENRVSDIPLARGSWASSPASRSVMRANRSRDTKPEIAIRRELHRLGFRYRVAFPAPIGMRRTIDIAFTRMRVAVFVDGCFWHGCPDHYRPATRNAAFWGEKINANRERDADTNRRLVEAGWTVIRIWEHEDPATAVNRITNLLRTRTNARDD